MRYYLGLFSVNVALTIISLYYPLKYYSETHSTTGLSVVITYYNVLNAVGSYFWGYVIDKMPTRKPLLVAFPLIQLVPTIMLFNSDNPIAYGLLGFTSALGSPLYSALILEAFPQESLAKENSYLSIATLGGNMAGSLLGMSGLNKELLSVALISLAAPLNAFLIPSYRAEVKGNSKLELSYVKEFYKPLALIFIFNMAAETFYVLYIPALEGAKAPSYFYFMSYMALYAVQLVLFFKAPSLVSGMEGFWALLAITVRSAILYFFVAGIPLNPYELSSLFVAFGSMWSIFSVPFYSLVLRTVRKNRGQISGLLAAWSDIGTSLGSFTTYVAEAFSQSMAYEISFIGFVASGIMWASYVRDLKRLSFSLLPRIVSSRPRPVAQRGALASESRPRLS